MMMCSHSDHDEEEEEEHEKDQEDDEEYDEDEGGDVENEEEGVHYHLHGGEIYGGGGVLMGTGCGGTVVSSLQFISIGQDFSSSSHLIHIPSHSIPFFDVVVFGFLGILFNR